MAKTPRIRMKDVSERAGVALSTVSHVLNGTAPISEEVRAKVLEAARDLGYLAKRKSKATIATLNKVMVAIPEQALSESDVNFVSWTILSTLTRECEERNVRMLPFTLKPGQPASELIGTAQKEDVDGVILFNDDRKELIRALNGAGLPSVLINGEDPEMLIDSVTPGNRFGAEMAVKWLLSIGHERILHLTWSGRKTVQRRLDGFIDALEAHNLPKESARTLTAKGFEPHFAAEAISEWITEHPDLDGVTAIFCAADNQAFGVIRELQNAGLRIPEDISVLGFDGVTLGELHSPPLTTVSVPLEQFAAEALELLERRIQAGPAPRAAHRLELGCKLIKRGSVASRN